MQNSFRRLLSGAAAAALFAVLPASAADAPDLEERFAGFARTFGEGSDAVDVMCQRAEYSWEDLDAGWATLVGNVAIRHKGLELRADRVRYNKDTTEAIAEGNVALMADGTLWRGDSISINVRERAGRAKGIDLYTEPFRVLADGGSLDAAVQTNQSYVIEGASITTCTNEPGHFHYYVHAKKARVRPADDITAWGAVPHLFGVPFFYWPYYWKDLARHYGFRFQPGFRHSWGAFLLATYKVPLLVDKENDAFINSHTFLDLRSKRGVAAGEKFSWGFGPHSIESGGFVTGWYMPEDHDPPKEVDPDDTSRYRVRFRHSWNATDRDQVLIHGLYMSDPRVLRDFFRKEYRDMHEPDNYATYTHYADDWSAGLTVRPRLNDFQSQVERLPELWFSLESTEIGDSGFYLENDTALSFLRRRWKEGSPNEEYDAFRGDSDWLLTYPGRYFGFLSVVPRAGYRGTWFSKTKDEVETVTSETVVTTNSFGDVFSETKEKRSTERKDGDAAYRSLFQAGFEVSTRAYGYWNAEAGGQWRHVLEPYVDYSFVPEPNVLPSELWTFDAVDRLDKRHTVRVGLRQRWQRRYADALHGVERFYVDAWADANLDPEEEEEAISGAGWDARYRPADWLLFQWKGRYDNDEGELDNTEVRLLAWHEVFLCDVLYRYRNDENSYFEGSVTWHANERWSFNLFGRYEFEDSQVEEVGGWIQHSWDCIALRVIASVEPGYTGADGVKEEDDWRISATAWLTDFPPDSILEEDNR